MAQAIPTPNHKAFFERFSEAGKTFDKPLLYIHADGHRWQVQKEWMQPNMIRVMTENIGDEPPVRVTVTLNTDEPFAFERQAPLTP